MTEQPGLASSAANIALQALRCRTCCHRSGTSGKANAFIMPSAFMPGKRTAALGSQQDACEYWMSFPACSTLAKTRRSEPQRSTASVRASDLAEASSARINAPWDQAMPRHDPLSQREDCVIRV